MYLTNILFIHPFFKICFSCPAEWSCLLWLVERQGEHKTSRHSFTGPHEDKRDNHLRSHIVTIVKCLICMLLVCGRKTNCPENTCKMEGHSNVLNLQISSSKVTASSTAYYAITKRYSFLSCMFNGAFLVATFIYLFINLFFVHV